MKTIDYNGILARKLAKMFPDPVMRQMVEIELGKYGEESSERGKARVQLDVLKVAGASIEKIREWIDIAKRDYRDVLAAAEYPNQLVAPTWSLPSSECERLESKDAEQYLRWIEED